MTCLFLCMFGRIVSGLEVGRGREAWLGFDDVASLAVESQCGSGCRRFEIVCEGSSIGSVN